MSRWRGLIGLAVAQLRYHWARGTLAVIGVALAVLLVTLLVALGYGLFTTGGEAIAWLERDLWVSGGGLGFQLGTVGGIENPIQNSHQTAAAIQADERVAAVQPIALMSVYVSPNTSSFDSTIGVGTIRYGTATGPSRVGFNDTHYANGTYNGSMTHEVVISPATADQYNLSVGDTLYIGGTLQTARANAFRVKAISSRYSTFLGTSAVAVPLSELQRITGTTGRDPAALLGVNLKPGADATAVEQSIEQQYPLLEVRGNDEQVQQLIGRQTAVVVGVLALVVVGLGGGFTLVVNVLATVVRSQQAELAALNAAGVATRSLVGVVFAQGALLGICGGLLGIGVLPVAVDLLNGLLADLSGFARLAKTPWWVYAGGFGLAVVVGTLAATVAGYQVARLSPLRHLDSQ